MLMKNKQQPVFTVDLTLSCCYQWTYCCRLAIWRSASSLKMSLTNQRDLAVQVATWSKFLCKLIWLCWNEKLKFLSLSSRQGNSFAIVLCQASRLLLLSFQDPKHSIKVNPPSRNENLERRTLFGFLWFFDWSDGWISKACFVVCYETCFHPREKGDESRSRFHNVWDQLSNLWIAFNFLVSILRFNFDQQDNPSTKRYAKVS